jgi:hypothetical protein
MTGQGEVGGDERSPGKGRTGIDILGGSEEDGQAVEGLGRRDTVPLSLWPGWAALASGSHDGLGG